MVMRDQHINKNHVRKHTSILLLLIVAVTLLVFNHDWRALAQEGDWTAPTVVSASPGLSWFPDLAVDELGSVHVVWCQSTPLERDELQEQVYYAHLSGTDWSSPNDIIPPSDDIVRNAVAADLAGNVHLLFGGSVYGTLALYHRKAPIREAWSAAVWSAPHRINQGMSYMGDMAVDSRGVIHVVYDDTLHEADEDELSLADVFYRRSDDGGRTWSSPIRLDPQTLTGSARPYIEIDSADVIHVTWDEGWDRLSGEESDALYGAYVSSSDWGETWTPPMVIEYPEATVVQLTVGSDGAGGVMLVWRATSRDEIFYQWSTDSGQSWGEPSVVPQILARPWTTPFDMYDMAADSDGHIHLLVVGRQSPEKDALLGVYHLVWDGERWSAPERVSAKTGLNPEYPKILVQDGNLLHAAWFTRAGSIWDSEADREVWYSTSQSPAPHQPVTPLPTATAQLPTATPIPIPTFTPYPTVSLEHSGLPDGLSTENDDILQLAVALSPVALLILIVAFIKTRGFGLLRR